VLSRGLQELMPSIKPITLITDDAAIASLLLSGRRHTDAQRYSK